MAWQPTQNYGFNLSRHELMKILLLIFSALIQITASAQYTNPLAQTDILFGLHSHWIQPWRGYLETVPASQFLNGVGVVLKSANPDLVCQMLSRHGVKITRIEIGWGNVSYTQGSITNPQAIAALQACAKWGLRPIILLNANHGLPCPTNLFNAVAAKAAAAGSTTLTLVDAAGIVAGKTGLSNVTAYIAAQILVTAVKGTTVTLSMPLPKAILAGQTLPMATLKYRPFSVPGSEDYKETLAGWKSYVLTVGGLASQYLGAGNFDLEVWNELTFGSNFLDINDYYKPALATYDEDAIRPVLVQATVDVATANPSVFNRVEISDGFANTLPWPASSTEPARVTGLSKHCYPPNLTFPAQEKKGGIVNALLVQESIVTFVPTYVSYFPEYAGTAIQTETYIRDISPISSDIQGVMHGRNTRPGNPCLGWITECGYDPFYSSVTDPATAMALKAKSTARYFCFFLNKGCKKVTVFSTGGGDARLGIVQDNFLNYCLTNTVYPTNDAPYTSPALSITGRIVQQMRLNASALETTRQLGVFTVTGLNTKFQFHGDETAAHPDLYDSDLLAILPFQSNPHRFVIPYYVMTRKLVPALTPEPFVITLSGLNPATTRVQCYDPMTDTYYPSSTHAHGQTVAISVNAADYPYLLIVTD